MKTPFFPAFRARFAALGRRTVTTVKAASVCQLEGVLGQWVGAHLLSDTEEKANSRRRVFYLRRTFWCFLWQCLSAQRACRDVVLQVQALVTLETGRRICQDTGAYVMARLRLPLERLWAILLALATDTARCVAPVAGTHGRRLFVVDATSVQLPDTLRNRRAYPCAPNQKPGCGFPLLKLSGLFNLASGAIETVAWAKHTVHELPLFLRIFQTHLRPGDIWIADALYAVFGMMAYSRQRGVDSVARIEGARHVDFRKGRKLGPQERLVRWIKPAQPSRTLPKAVWCALPQTMELRLIRVRLLRKGWRTLSFFVVTTLLDPEAYPAEILTLWYLRRWRIELSFRDLKTSLGMEMLRTKSPAMVLKELLMFLIAHNFIRRAMADAAQDHHVELDALSFMGAVAAVRQYAIVLAHARSRRQRRTLLDTLCFAIANEILPDRPHRLEPRVVKRRPKPFPRMTRPRNELRAQLAASLASSSKRR